MHSAVLGRLICFLREKAKQKKKHIFMIFRKWWQWHSPLKEISLSSLSLLAYVLFEILSDTEGRYPLLTSLTY